MVSGAKHGGFIENGYVERHAIAALREEHGAMLAGVEGRLGLARVAVTAGGARRALDAAVAERSR